MSSTVQLRVECERCGADQTIEPVEPALRYAKQINANSSAEQLKLYELRERPRGWGTVEWKRSDGSSSTTRELCGECLDAVLETLNDTTSSVPA